MNSAVVSWLSMSFYLFVLENHQFQATTQTINEAGANAELANLIKGLFTHQWSIGSNRKIYLVSKDTLPFYDAKDFCNQEGGKLASINNEEDQIAVEALTYDERIISGNPLWLGLYETAGHSHGEWLWLKRNKIFRRIKRFSHWAVQQLNKGDPLRDCAVLGLDGLWEVKSCDEKAKALCEGDPEKAGFTNYKFAQLDQDRGKAAQYAKKLLLLLGNTSGSSSLGYPPQMNAVPPRWNTVPPINHVPGMINAGVQLTGGAAPLSPQNTQTTPSFDHSNIKNIKANPVEGKNISSMNTVEMGKPKLAERFNETLIPQQNDTVNGTLAESKEKLKKSEVRCALLNFLNIYGKPVKILRVVNDRAAKSLVFNESNYKLKTIFKRIANVTRMKPVEYYAESGDKEERLLLDGMKSLPLIPGDCQGEFMDVSITKKDEQPQSEQDEPKVADDSVTPTVAPTEKNAGKDEDKMSVSTKMASPPRGTSTKAKLSTTPRPKTHENTPVGSNEQATTTISTTFWNATHKLTSPTLAMTTHTPQTSGNNVKEKCKIETFGGNNGGDCCRFPFKYQNIMYYDCTTADSHHAWCATTHNFDQDKHWAFCCSKEECS